MRDAHELCWALTLSVIVMVQRRMESFIRAQIQSMKSKRSMAVPPNQKPSWIKAHREGMVMSVVEERALARLYVGRG